MNEMKYNGRKPQSGKVLVASSCQASLLPLTSVNGSWILALLPLTSVNGKETASMTTRLQPHSMWLKPLPFMKSADRQLKQTAITSTQY